jgi:hypothetical protein
LLRLPAVHAGVSTKIDRTGRLVHGDDMDSTAWRIEVGVGRAPRRRALDGGPVAPRAAAVDVTVGGGGRP